MTEADAATPPGGEPGDKEQASQPPADGGAFFVSPGDWFKRHKDLSEAFKISSYKFTVGATARFVGSLTTNITRGHSHTTTLGFARSVVFVIENKFNLGAVFYYIREGRHEETKLSRSEYVLGMKYERYDHDRTLHENRDTTHDDVAVRERKTKIIAQHVSKVERMVGLLIEEDIKKFEEEHQKMEALVKTHETEVKKAVTEVETWIEKGKESKSKIKDCQEECQKTEAKYSDTFKSIASAAHEITSTAKEEKNMKGEVRFMAGSLVKLAAAVTKAG